MKSKTTRERPKRSSRFDITHLRQDPVLYSRALEEVLRIEAERSHPEFEVHFSIPFCTKFGERILITGSHEQLGNWVGDRALELQWTPGNIWRGSMTLREVPAFEYKYICIGCGNVRWEEGPNRKISEVSIELHGGKKVCRADDYWRS